MWSVCVYVRENEKRKKQMKIVLTKCHKIKILSFLIWNTDLQQVLNILLEMVCHLY